MTKAPKNREPQPERHEHHIHQDKSRSEWILEVVIALMVLGTLIATSIAAYWTSWQWKTADDTERRQLRAYIGVAAGDVEDFGIEGKQRVHLVRKNHGQTPAYEVGFSSIGSFVVSPVGGRFTVNQPGACSAPSVAGLITMFPTVELPLTINTQGAPAPKEQIQLVKSGDTQFVYFGNVCYRDAFGVSHYTNYCYIYKGTSMTSKDADPCLQYNDSN